jgi:hypothetical protein
MKTINDPANYLKLSEPFDSPDEANAALSRFMVEVREARQKHRIADCSVAVAVSVRYEDGTEGVAMTCSHNGDHDKAEPLLAFALGKEQALRREYIAKLIAGRKP